jgi:ABC-type antimicrobial peptide transport system permease subunit
MDHLVADSIANRWFLPKLTGSFAMAALLLATLGIFSLLTFLMASRFREIGVRMAPGADTSRIRSSLYGISSYDPVVLVLACTVLIAAGVLAAIIPGWRASSVDPQRAIRME